ncbi:S-ribosylhomocysteine lyase [Corynebacterium sp. HMSC062E11]|uniref:S-ribosylhomocysteine lyase n=1 Tax=Corynebacterium hesseae TaxID=2913502 RepID=A0ABU9UHB2_9CORY|nr:MULTISPECIES: S-ribosylhomocysteine lyase [Corynebacterium]MDK6806709.1 S-ribosylhomocysteine lyase [Corynebacterium aurimucosum]MTD97575.1 S-ribosylhomocysteine lyase [Corynebacterium guaraldiae]NJJ81986.1 S-ribosylhomocysteine lyase [Corynebacterium aurimucosum]OFK29393.1 S-ribosylhomocysteine lyase [Corynebacterium sp. HMSC062E11]OFK62820.1 S-ribosylhomocysteine lyase [Corynebacterium sp. HMSC078A10]
MTEKNTENKINVKSFELDHRLVAAPYIRVADRTDLGGGVEIIKYDLRFCQPNKEHLGTEALHSVEHMMANFMRNYTDKLIGFAPMGCRTGFYAITNGMEQDELLRAVDGALNDILNATEVPAANEVQCGWGAHHSLEGAQEAARNFLAAKEEWLNVMA